jgi:CheY-like chemotaxis protein
VLVVDDDRSVRHLMAVMVAQDGYETLEAKNEGEALHLAETNRIDLLITDVEMPGVSGPELMLSLRKRGLIERSLLVTGNVDAIHSFRSSHGQVPFLAKPFNSGQLLGKIHAILND